MGGIFSCIEGVPSMKRIQYDLTPLKAKSAPIVWLIGPPGSGRRTQGDLLSEHLAFENIKITQLLKDESAKDTERGHIINDAIKNRLKKIPDILVVDLIKEAMLKNVETSRGFIINNFPKSPKQAELFVREISNVNVIVHLTSETEVLVERIQQKINGRLNNDTIRRKIDHCNRDIRECLSKFSTKIRKVDTSEAELDVFAKILEAINDKLGTKSTSIISETEYAQSAV